MAALLTKPAGGSPIEADYSGFTIGDEFVVGYGLDYDDYYRNLPDIVTLRPEVVAGHESGDQPIGGNPRASGE